jgi:putative Mg2+ transporter-C (MgtC) family protein
VLTIKSKQESENHVRILLIQHTNDDDKLILRSLKSTDNGDPFTVIITAEIFAIGNQDQKMERIAGRLTLEPGIAEVSWKVTGEENDL